MNKTRKLLFVYKGMPKQRVTSAVNVVLTPQFYTLKRENIPVRYAYQAKRIAPSLFEGLIDDTKCYRYFVVKEDEGWLFLAYNLHEIEDFLSEKGIDAEYVKRVFFAEQMCELFTEPMVLGEKEALVCLNGTVVVVPSDAIDSVKKMSDVEVSAVPRKGISLESTSHSFFTTKQAYIFAGIFALFAILFIFEGIYYASQESRVKKDMEKLLLAYPTLKSSYVRKSIQSKYRAIDTKERKKRDRVKSLSHMLFKGVKLVAFVLTDKTFQATFSYTSEDIASKLRRLAKEAKLNITTINTKHMIKIEGTL